MSHDTTKLVMMVTLPRDEDPMLFDHFVRFGTGRRRAARMKALLRKGLMFEQLQSGNAGSLPAISDTQRTDEAVMDQIFPPAKS